MRGHCGHGLSRRPRLGRARQQLELVDRPGSLPMHRAQAVGAGIAAADDDHALAGSGDELILGDLVPFATAVLLGQEVDGEVNARQVAARHLKIAGRPGAAAQHNRVELPAQIRNRKVHTDVHAGAEHDAFLLEQRKTPVHHALLDLELGDAVPQQSADAVGLLEDRHQVPGPIQLVGRREAGRPRSDHGDALPGPGRGRRRADPAFLERALDDRQLDVLDRHRVVVDAEDARSFARRRAQPAGEVREVVGRVQPVDRRPPALAVDEIVPFRDLVAERAPLVAERNPAVHAARALVADFLLGCRQVDLVPIRQADMNRARVGLGPLDLDEAGDVTHWRLPPARRTPARGSRTAPGLPPAARA